MPRVSRFFVKSALLYLLVAAGAGVVFVLVRAAGHSYSPGWPIAHMHAGVIGFVLNMVVGVAYWMFPRVKGRFPETGGRYHPVAAWFSYVLINTGLVVRLISEPPAWEGAQPGWMIAYAGSAVVLFAGIATFIVVIWPRIREILPPEGVVRE